MLKKYFIVFLLFSSVYTWSQNKPNSEGVDSVAVSDKKTVTFETYYYEALKEKIKGNNAKAVELLRSSLRFQPSNADVQFELSINYKSLKDYRQAILFGENAVRFNPNNKWYWLNVADLYSLASDTKNAERCYAKLTEFDAEFIPEYVRTIARSGDTELALSKINVFLKTQETEELLVIKRDLLVINEKHKEAILLTDKLIEINPNNSNYYFDISELLLNSKEDEKAESYVRKGLDINPDSPILLRQEFKILMRKSDFDEAFIILENVFHNNKLDFNEKLSFVIEFVNNDTDHHETKRLISALEKWVSYTHEVKIYPIIANLYKVDGQNEKSLDTFRKGFYAGYTEFSGLIDMLLVEQELGEYRYLKDDTEKLLELYPSHPIIYLFKGFSENQLNEYESSISTLNEGIEYVVNNDKLKAEFHSLIADGYYRMDELEKCFTEFDKAIYFDPENISVLNNYSYYLAENNQNLDKALLMIKQVLETESENYTYLDTLAWVYYKQGEFDKAKSVLKNALKNGGDKSADILEHYGDVLFRLNKVKQAVKQWKKAYGYNSESSILKNKIQNKSIQE